MYDTVLCMVKDCTFIVKSYKSNVIVFLFNIKCLTNFFISWMMLNP